MIDTRTLLMSTAAMMMGGVAQAQTPAPSPSPAPATAGSGKVVTGATVTDTAGGMVGTIKAIEGEFAVLSTGTVDVRLPMTSFAAGTAGPVIGMTKAQVEAAASGASGDQKAKLAAQLTTGGTVSDTKGGTVGTIDAVDAQFVTVATAKNKVKLPVSAFAAGTSGPVIAMTAAEIDAAAATAAPPPVAAAPTTTSATTATPPKASGKVSGKTKSSGHQ